MNAYAEVFAKMTRLSGVCPMVALVLGPCAGGAALISQIADVSIQAEKVGELMVYGPQVMSSVSGETLTGESLGGAKAMAAQGGVALTAASEDEAISLAVQVLDLLPGSNAEDAPLMDGDDMNRLLPAMDAMDSDALLAAMADNASFIELYKEWGKALRVALCRMGGRSVGIVCSNAKENDGMITPAAAAKAARFIRLCDCYSLPVVSLINSKGVAVPEAKAQSWTMITASQLLYAYAEATCPQGFRGGRQRYWSGLCGHGRQGKCGRVLRLAGCGDFCADSRSGGAGTVC